MSFGIVPAGYSMLLWAPLLGVLGGLLLWLLALMLLQQGAGARQQDRAAARWAAGVGVEWGPGLALAGALLGVVAVLGG